MVLLLGHLTGSLLTTLVVVGSVVDQPLLVAAAGLVVVLAILLVFVMVLRSGGNKRSSVGIGYDAQQGPLGQPRAPLSQPGGFGPRSSAQAWPQGNSYGAPGGQENASARGWGAGYQNPWNEPAPSQPSQAPGWGAPAQPGQQPGQQLGQWQDQGGWGQALAGQPAQAALRGSWGQPQPEPPMSQGAWGPPAGGQPMAAGGWGQQATPSAGGWGPPADQAAGGWGGPAADQGAGWGGPTAAPPQGGFGAPAAPSGAGWGGGATAGGGAGQAYAPADYGDMDRARAARGMDRGMDRGAVLVVRQGKEPGRSYDVRKDRMTIGRNRESDIFLEDLAVSRTHTSIGRDERGRYIVRDENSANGTFVNNQRITEQVLEDGDEIQVGQTVLAFSRR